MEKFGIFELLDALAALTAPGAPQGPPSQEEKDEQGEKEQAKAGKRQPDDSFRAPAYGGAQGLAPDRTESSPPLPPTEEQTGGAIGGFLSRHDKISKNARK